LFKNTLFILVFISLFSILELLVAATEKLRIELESELELDSISFEILIISESKLKLIKISIRVLRIVLVFSLIYQ
jgi:hypothetical protein